MVALEPSELLSVMKIARANSTRDWAMILVAYCHGLRASEVCGLTLTDISLKTGSIKIARLKGSLETTQALSAHKGNPLLDEFVALRSWLKERTADGSEALFDSQKGGSLDRSQFYRIFRGYAQKSGLPATKQHPHCLKHSLATHLISADTNLAKVQQALGHRSIGSTMQYVRVTDAQADDARRSALMNIF
jgi:type 1 fimbriae regulatory protein FimB